MAITASLTISPSKPAAGAALTATYSVSGAAGTAQTVSFSGTVTMGGTAYPNSTGSFSLPGAASAVTYSVPSGGGMAWAKTSNPAVFTATVPAAGTTAGAVKVSGSVKAGSAAAIAVSASVTLPGAPVTPPPVTPPPVTPPPSGTAPFPAALAAGHTLTSQYLPADLYAWRYQPGTTTPVVNGGGITENPDSTRNVTLATDGGLSVLKLAVTSASDCGVIQSPGKYPTSSGVVETLIKFSGFTSSGSAVFADWASFWLYGDDWPVGGELDAVETQYGNSFVSYHYGTGSGSEATTDPWTYTGKTVQLSPKNSTSAPAAPNILPDTWTYVTLAFGKDASGNYKCDVYYNGALYCTIDGSYVTGGPMYITAGTSFGASGLGSNQAPYDQPGSIEIQYVRVFS